MRRVAILFAVLAGALLAPAAAQAQFVACPTIPNPIACENSKPGTPPDQWEIFKAGDPAIQGFATQQSVNRGQSIAFKIKTSYTYRIDIYRLGYYGGNGARLIASNISHASAQSQPACLTDSSTGLIDCGNWATSATWTVPSNAVSGIYIAKLYKSTDIDASSHITFVVRDDSSTSDIVVQTSDATWHAYNTYGGNSLYKCTVACPPGNPLAYKGAFAVSYNRPLLSADDDNGRSFIWNAEYPLLRFLEANGYHVSYLSQVDTEARPALLRNHKVFVSSGHDEYWSATQRANIQAARDAGVNLAFFTGNTAFWKTRYAPSSDGTNTPNRTLISYKDTHFDAATDPVEWTGTWRDRRFDAPGADYEPENSLIGLSFLTNLDNSPITVPHTFKSLRFWRNTAVANLSSGQTATLAPGTLGYEWDADADNGFRPPGQFRLSSTTVSGIEIFRDYGSSVEIGTGTHNMVMYRAPSGALVFNTGTVQWAWGLDQANPDSVPPNTAMRQATVNVLADMGAQPSTLMSGLVTATQSLDTAKPTATITSPANNASRADGTRITVTGTASDLGGVVAGVEVSTDGGQTWHPANGTTSWSYSWVVHGHPSTQLRARAVDDSGNLGAASAGVNVTVTCGCSIFGDGVIPPVPDSGDPTPVELGVKFTADRYGQVSGIRFFKSAANTGTHVGSLWNAQGDRLAQATFTNETTSGWQTVTFAEPVTIEAGRTYVASYFAPAGRYAATPGYFWRAPSPPPHGLAMTDSGPLHAVRNSGATTNGVFRYTSAPTFPNLSNDATNYWVDVVYAPIPPPGQVTGVTAESAGRTSAQVSWTAPSTGGAPTSYTVTPYVNGAAQAPTTVTGEPPLTTATVKNLTSGTTYQFRVQASNPSGSGPASALSNEVTPLDPVAPSAPTGVSARPATTSAHVSWTPPGSDGDSPITGYTITPYVGSTAQAPVSAGASATSKVIDGLTNGMAYTFRVTATNDVGTSSPSAPSAAITPQHTLREFATPQVADSQDSTSVELGMKFQADVDGTATGVRFYKSTANTGTHVGSLWTAGGTRLAQVTFTGESDSGWQTATFSQPVPITAGTTYVVSYHAPSGRYSHTSQGFADGVENWPLRAVANSTSANGVYAYSATSTFPNQTYNAADYGVDLLFALPKPGAVGTVTAREGGSTSANVSWEAPDGSAVTGYRITPYVGSTAQVATTITGNPPATSKKIGGLTTGTTYTFTVQALNTSGAGPASAQSNAVTPTAPVAPGAPTGVVARPATKSALVSWTAPDDDGESAISRYTVTPYAGAVAGDPVTVGGSATSTTVTGLANGTSYTFRVSATNEVGTGPESSPSAAVTPRYTLFDFAGPAVADAGESNALELGMKFRADDGGSVTGVRFYKSAANTGTHVGSLWTAGGTLLARATFTQETATGWQAAIFDQPVAITAGATYVVSYHTTRGHYAASSGAFSEAVANPPLRGLADATSPNGVFAYTASPAFPSSSWNASNYWVDVLFAAAPPPGEVTNVSATAQPGGATVSWTAPSSGGAPASYEVVPYVGTTAQPATTVTGTPPATSATIGGLTPGTSYTFRVRAVNGEGPGPLSAASNAVTPTAAGVPAAPTGVSAEPDAGSARVSWTPPADDGGSAITGYSVIPHKGTEALAPTQTGPDATSVRVTGLEAGAAHTFRVRAVNDAGTGAESAASDAVVPLSSIFGFATPGVVDGNDGNAVNLGVKFRSSVAGAVTGVRFHKAQANTGTHVGSLWTEGGQLLAQATFSGETADGWQKVLFAQPVAIQPDTTYVVSYHAPNGRYSVTGAAFGSGPVSNPPLTALADGVSPNGVYAYGGAPAFPTSTFNAANYWVDVLFSAGA